MYLFSKIDVIQANPFILSTMNRKLLLLLLALPVAVFATDRLTTPASPDGGGKEKKTTASQSATAPETSTVEPAATEAVVPQKQVQMQVQDQSQDITPAPSYGEAEANSDQMVAELKKTLDNILSDEGGYYNQDEAYSTVWVGD
jgi:hypothetical protein